MLSDRADMKMGNKKKGGEGILEYDGMGRDQDGVLCQVTANHPLHIKLYYHYKSPEMC